MKLSQIIKYNLSQFNFEAKSKEEALEKITDMLKKEKIIKKPKELLEELIKRERQSSTGVGQEIAIPHAKSSEIKEAIIIYAKSNIGVEWQSFDEKLAKHIFMILAPTNGTNQHLKALSNLSTALMNKEVKEKLENVEDGEQLKTIFKTFEQTEEKKYQNKKDRPFIVAVTACPTGIAHTFMAKEKLKEAAEELEVEIKVETNGQIGIENKLTNEEIKKAIGVIVAADKKVELARFNGKPTIITKVSDGINKPKELINNILDNKVTKYKHHEKENYKEETTNESLARKIYKHLMEGVSNMLPFVVAGGMLIAISFFWGITSFNPEASDYNKLAAIIFWFGKISFSMMLPILAGFIGRSLADRPGFVLGVFGGILADPSILSVATGNEIFNYTPSGFLGALVAGFLAGGVIKVLKFLFSWIPQSLDGLKPIFIFPVLGTAIMGTLMIFLINAPMANVMTSLQTFIESLNGSGKLLIGFVVASMMAIDMGGPINKASYVTGTALLASAGSAGSDVMASVMIGGMVPPLAIALSAIINKNIWPENQRNGAYVNIVMGAAFITEGAIPFAASNPVRVIPPLFLGSGIAGALSMIFEITSKVPHGGIFAVIANGVTNPLMYILALMIGALTSTFLLILSLKTIKK